MSDVVLGLLAILVGGLFCFQGFMTMRIVIPIWGAFVGFMLGAGLAESFTSDGFLGSLVDWLVGLAVGFVFAVIAYAYYEVSVFLAMGAIGFVLGTSLMVALGVTWSWLIVLGGVALGALLAIGAIVGDLPGFLLVLLTALGGASTIVFGVLLMFGRLDTDEVAAASTPSDIGLGWGWYVLYGGLAVAGMATQFVRIEQLNASMRESWAEAGGREFRSS